MTRITFVVILIVICSCQTKGQFSKTSNFIGLNPSVTVEPFYEKGEFDINIFPIVYQVTLTNRIDCRISTILNYRVKKTKNEMSHLGGQLSFPVFIKKKDNRYLPSSGLFIAPGGGFTRNRIEKHTNIGFWIEPGYSLMISEKWSIFFGVQFGATHFNYDNGTKNWGNHFGVKIIVGRWFCTK